MEIPIREEKLAISHFTRTKYVYIASREDLLRGSFVYVGG